MAMTPAAIGPDWRDYRGFAATPWRAFVLDLRNVRGAAIF